MNIKTARELGRPGTCRYAYYPCADCGTQRWVRIWKDGYINRLRCPQCAAKSMRGSKHGQWRGGYRHTSNGYLEIKLQPEDAFYPMVNKDGYVLEHRLIVARQLGRCLLKSEPVHHINGIKDDNRDENLVLLSRNTHSIRNKLCGHCELRKEIRLQKWQIKNLEEQVRNLTATLFGVRE